MTVKQIGFKPCPRSGISCTVIPNTNKILFFGGVQDIQDDNEDSDDEDDDEHGNFFNDLYSVHVENERATWSKIGKKLSFELWRENSKCTFSLVGLFL